MDIKGFENDLKDLLNNYGIDDYLNIPDFILAEHITDVILSIGRLHNKTVEHDAESKKYSIYD